MPRFLVKPGDRITVEGGTVLQMQRICGNCSYAYLIADESDSIFVEHGEAENPDVDVQTKLKEKAEEVFSLFSDMDAASSLELLSRFVSDLFYKLAQKRQKEERRQKQAEGIARAKANGIRFGPAARPLPDGFAHYAQMWRHGEISARDAAKALGMTHSTFLRWAKECEAAG